MPQMRKFTNAKGRIDGRENRSYNPAQEADFAGGSTLIAIEPTVATATPIQHLVVIFDSNESFDHYFGTYPNATNPAGEPAFHALPGTPTGNGYTPSLLTNNPNLNPANGTGAENPFRLDRSQAITADQDHDYTPEQPAHDMGALDLFPLYTAAAGPPPPGGGVTSTNGLVLGYLDGTTIFWSTRTTK